MQLSELNQLPADEAVATFMSCCASRAWAEAMAERRPFQTPDDVYSAAENVWWQLPRMEWLVAFAAHPRIGERKAAEPQHGQGDAWSEREQAGVWSDPQSTRDELRELNQKYEQRFGHGFLVFASGKSGEDLLTLLRQRIENDPETELHIAAAEQARITKLRLQRLLENAP